MKTWNNPELFQLGVESTKADTFQSNSHDGVWVDVVYKGGDVKVELHS